MGQECLVRCASTRGTRKYIPRYVVPEPGTSGARCPGTKNRGDRYPGKRNRGAQYPGTRNMVLCTIYRESALGELI